MCYWILNQRGAVISRSTVQRVTNLELSTSSVKDIFDNFDTKIHHKLKREERGYVGNKPNPDDWADLMEDDEDFRDEFANVYNDSGVPEADEFTPEVLEDTYVNMEVALPRKDDGSTFAKVTKRLRDANGIPIGVTNENPILDTRVYEVEYMDGRKALLAANANYY